MKNIIHVFGLLLAIAAPAVAQDAVRSGSRPANWNIGATCPTGQVATVNAVGMISCTDTINNANTAATATTATVATTAQQLDSGATVNASQLSGSLSASQLQGAMPACSSGQVLTNTNGTFSCVTPAGGGAGAGATSCTGGLGSYDVGQSKTAPIGNHDIVICTCTSGGLTCNNPGYCGVC
jgi:hypothetical protein